MPTTAEKDRKMQSNKAFLVACAVALCAGFSFSSEQDNALIKEVQVRDNGLVIVIMNEERTLESGTCVNTTYHKTHWAFNPSTTTGYREFLATLLTAKTTSSPVRITGTATCSAFSSIETLQTIAIK
jgi:hypothetical protein